MRMGIPSGWNFWLTDGKHVRQLSVAVKERGEAEKILQGKFPGLEIISRHELPKRVIDCLKLQPGDAVEWRLCNGH